MKTKTALALSLTGILLTGSAALAGNSQTPSRSHPGISDDVKNVLVADDSVTGTPAPSTAPARATIVANAGPEVAAKGSDDKKVSAAKKAVSPAEPGEDNGGRTTARTFTGSGTAFTSQPGDDKGGTRTTPEPGDDNGGLRSAPAPRAAQASDDRGGLRTTPEPGDDKGGLRKTTEPGDDSGGHGGHGRDD